MSTIKLNPIKAPVHLPKPEGYRNVSTSVGAAGEAIQLWVSEAEAVGIFATEVQPGWAIFPKTHTEYTYTAKVTITTQSTVIDHQLPFLAATHPLVQTLPENDVLVVAPRCRRFQNGTHEMNAKIYHPDGSLKSEFCLGDGIEHVQVDHTGRIWVGYFDEGIFGNFGWGGSGDATPLGVAGLVCYDSFGNKVWQFDPPGGFESIADCYALNVADEAVWACYYTHFPVIRIDSNWHVQGWATELSGPRELAVAGDSVLVYGGYGENRMNCKLLCLRGERTEETAEVELRFPKQVDHNQYAARGRGKLLHVFAGDEWYIFSPET